MREPEDEEEDVHGGTESKSKNTFLKIPNLMPTVQMTPPTPTTVEDIDGVEAKRRRTESPKSFKRKFRKSSSKGNNMIIYDKKCRQEGLSFLRTMWKRHTSLLPMRGQFCNQEDFSL